MAANRLAVVALVLLGLGSLMIAGCQSKVNKSNYDRVTAGMTVAEVEAILGKPSETSSAAGAVGDLSGSVRTLTWRNEERTITVNFVNDKVVTKTASGI